MRRTIHQSYISDDQDRLAVRRQRFKNLRYPKVWFVLMVCGQHSRYRPAPYRKPLPLLAGQARSEAGK